jgi:hypothetical protein
LEGTFGGIRDDRSALADGSANGGLKNMGKSSRDRVRAWRDRKARKGGRSFSTWLEPETARMLDELLQHYGETAAVVIARAIAALYGETASDAKTMEVSRSGEHFTGTAVVEKMSTPVAPGSRVREIELEEGDLRFETLRREVERGLPLHELRGLLIASIRALRARQVSFKEIAERLNQAGIPTLSGKGEWEEGMIPTILILAF